MARGGTRPGAGRKPGAPNKATAVQRKRVEESGLTPLEYMLQVLRDQTAPKDDRMWAAEKAAPFVHPRLAAIEHSGPNGGPIPVAAVELTDNELAAIAAAGSGRTSPEA